MNSREGFPQAGGPDGISPPAVASDRAAKAYEKAFLESANSNESKIRLLEERMKRPPAATAQMSDAVRAGGPDAASDDEDEDEQRDFGVHYSRPEKRRRRSGKAGAGRDNSPGASKMPPPGTGAGAQHIEAYFPAADVDADAAQNVGGSRESPSSARCSRRRRRGGRTKKTPPDARRTTPRFALGSHALAHSASARDVAAALDAAREEGSRSRKEADEARRRAEALERALAEARERADAATSDARDAEARVDAASKESARAWTG